MFSHRFRYLFILLLSIYSYLNILFTEGYRLFGVEVNGLILLGTIMVVVLEVWEFNRLFDRFLQKHLFFPTVHRLIKLFVASLFNVVIISFLVSYVDANFLGVSFEPSVLKLALGFSFRINLFLSVINALHYYINKTREAQVQAEELKRASVQAEFEALKNQVNPHFLFNSLNVLASLVHERPDMASDFIERLAKVYRYILLHKEEDTVTLEEECNFIKSYLFLLKARYPENLNTNLNIDKEFLDYRIPPATLQILIENAIKHNVISKKHPLTISIGVNGGDFLEVENNLKSKKLLESSTSVGLRNIQDRYRIICNKDITIERNDSSYKVKLPLILPK